MQLSLLAPDVQAERIARDAGIAAAAAHANARAPLWTDQAFAFFRDFTADKPKGTPFMTEDVRVAAEKAGVPLPPDRRAWGAVATRAVAQKIIKRMGYAPQRSAGCHMAPKTLWKRA